MIPVLLTIEGLYSYQERQTIDFSNLTDAGLFGIFGKVGSGKSSILEAITYALYGETERLNARDKRTYNMMNLKSNRSYIEFDFYNFENRLFRATREFKRNSKNFEDIKSPTVIFYEFINNEWIPLERSDSEVIVGLSYTNFKRTIIIPQGQFKEFLELGEAARTQMMKEIFNLNKFDLQDKVSTLNKHNQSELDQLQGKLSGYTNVSTEIIDEKKRQLSDEQILLKNTQVQHQQISDQYQQLKTLKTDYELLQEKQKIFDKLSEEKESMDLKKYNLETYERIFKAFQPLLTEEKRIQADLFSKNLDLESQQTIKENTSQQLQDITKKLEHIRPQYETLSILRQEETDLENIVQILHNNLEIQLLQNRSLKGQEKVKESHQKEQSIDIKIKSLESDIKKLNEQRIEPQLLLEVGNWFNESQHLARSIEKQIENIDLQKKQLDKLAEDALLQNLDLSTFAATLDIRTIELNQQKISCEQRKNQLLVQQQMTHYADALHDGEACPLCGATEHPAIVEATDVSQQLDELHKTLSTIESEQLEWQNRSVQVQSLRDREKIFTDQWHKEKDIYQELLSKQEEQIKAFAWFGFDRTNYAEFEKKKQEAKILDQNIQELHTTINEQRRAWESERQSLDKYKKALEAFKLTEAQLESKIEVNKSKLRVLAYSDFTMQNPDEVVARQTSLQQKINSTEEIYLRLQQQFNELNPKLAALTATVDAVSIQINGLKTEKENLNKRFITALEQELVASMEEAQKILNQKLDTVSIRKELETFLIRFETTKHSLEELALKLKGLSFDQERYLLKENEWNELTAALKIATEKVTRLQAEAERLINEFNDKKELLAQLDALEKRAANLKVMMNLFKGAGFVQYVSSIYLRQLCDHANIRFHRMTRNQLSLQLNSSNDFEIIDYLNEGRSRNVKTLSGGQSFQASLSLALALAESIQSHAKANKNFFFIDEGFGTQDTESVNTVFETLTNLQKENRIVGIISHVEELQERIPTSVHIQKDEEKGSLIFFN